MSGPSRHLQHITGTAAPPGLSGPAVTTEEAGAGRHAPEAKAACGSAGPAVAARAVRASHRSPLAPCAFREAGARGRALGVVRAGADTACQDPGAAAIEVLRTAVELGVDHIDTADAHGPYGDEVYYAGAIDRPGANSRYHAVDERIVGRKPATLSFTEAAALPLTALAAWEGLFERLGLRTGALEQTGALLITAAAGGVGSIAAQLARALTSLTVIGTASRPESADFARRMGVQHVVDHHKPLAPQLAEVAPNGIDFVFSTTGTDHNLAAYAEALNPFGHIVAIDDFEALPLGVLKPKSISFHWEFMYTRSMFRTADQQMQHHILTQVARLVDAGVLTTTATRDLGRIDAANLREAHRLQESGTAVGKTTLTGF
ncbi:zinc-binding alcohol dehydrogenase family protein [Streptomyces sp. Ag109_O5-1]|uniref:zinc-binding alcohol dehydrogenase family protein n=1 Tax=Streptomyces sp. Ag109_O5-1 TaxID=1938851 RepID=UPI0021A33B1E|nr:zinc-binding alcohol dehydrogenase family protein [Streptomyces sp. Ag109_O5-1]